ncbi:Alcohol dehydrogenase GroES domain protein [Beutenbergia cavernae DSM 12333]|uniref:Alcohol dehydrogenase GroES domain protein n=1 Tax=Beutenbergia cavernae (strain ATCC BAA-8 / DSM 12333 / CCUG 43141 / JCM 11478 / NBRC 16432 / NCIMB 13614 / HKI 0122) TaxID=471853 RepID=C5BVD0_BEUC1|nr:zinc-binding dehydrogenase [Beutenbergia cavernae]ACQ80517.1 Alcohol dehydrogenase GroES domain protein [Beutenbergia cavernae DSM 12333]
MTISEAPRLVGDERIDVVPISYPDPGAGQLLLRVRANALCGSDRGAWAHGADVVPGHELAGEVVAAGPETRTSVGTRGVVYLMVFCGRCRNCRRGMTNLCLDKQGDVGFNRDGGLGPFVLVEERVFFAVDDDVPFALATMLLDVMGTSGHALDRAERLLPDVGSIHVVGAGPVGLGTLVMARIRYGDDVPIAVSDVSPERLGLAASLGATVAVAPHEVGSLEPVDLAVDSSGRTEARAAALAGLRKPGVLVCVGHGQELHLDVSRDLIATERAVIGSEYFPYGDLERNLELLRDHRDAVARVITHTFDVAELAGAFTTFLGGGSGKVVVTQDGVAR